MKQKAKRKLDGSIGNPTKRKKSLKNRQHLFKKAKNMMEEAFFRFPHLPE